MGSAARWRGAYGREYLRAGLRLRARGGRRKDKDLVKLGQKGATYETTGVDGGRSKITPKQPDPVSLYSRTYHTCLGVKATFLKTHDANLELTASSTSRWGQPPQDRSQERSLWVVGVLPSPSERASRARPRPSWPASDPGVQAMLADASDQGSERGALLCRAIDRAGRGACGPVGRPMCPRPFSYFFFFCLCSFNSFSRWSY
jgi:hypothetical protein